LKAGTKRKGVRIERFYRKRAASECEQQHKLAMATLHTSPAMTQALVSRAVAEGAEDAVADPSALLFILVLYSRVLFSPPELSVMYNGHISNLCSTLTYIMVLV
jgi:hypothetical protein